MPLSFQPAWKLPPKIAVLSPFHQQPRGAWKRAPCQIAPALSSPPSTWRLGPPATKPGLEVQPPQAWALPRRPPQAHGEEGQEEGVPTPGQKQPGGSGP